MQNKLESYLENEGYFVFPRYELELSKYGTTLWEKSQLPFTFDLLAVEKKGTSKIIVYFHLDKGTAFSGQTAMFFHEMRYRRFVLAAIFRELKTCGLTTGHSKLKIALNDVSENPHYRAQIETFCQKQDYQFYVDHLLPECARAA